MAVRPQPATRACARRAASTSRSSTPTTSGCPRKLEKTLAALDNDSGAAMVYTNASMIGANGEMLGTTYTPAD